MECPAPFSYEGLELDERSIRLITLHKGEPGSPVICDIAVYETSKAPAYRALSYTWGAPGNERAISLNERCFMVRPNLYSFFEQKRPSDGHLLLWIDAICINQHNIPERNQVVSSMDQVYSRAELVYAWLGVSEGDTAAAFGLLKAFIEVAREKRRYHNDGTPKTWTFFDSSYAAGWKAILSLCRRPYCGRLWVIQEILLAKTVTVCCGEFEVLLSDVHRFGSGLRGYVTTWNNGQEWSEELAPVFSGIMTSGAASLIEMSNGTHGTGPVRLMGLLARFSEAGCQDPRDGLFGFLGVAHDLKAHRKELVDYTREPLEILLRCLPYLGGEFKTLMWLARSMRIDLGELFPSRDQSNIASSPKEAFTSLVPGRSEALLARRRYACIQVLCSEECCAEKRCGTLHPASILDRRLEESEVFTSRSTRAWDLEQGVAHLCNAWDTRSPYPRRARWIGKKAADDSDCGPQLCAFACADTRCGDLLLATGRTILLVVRVDSEGTARTVGTAVIVRHRRTNRQFMIDLLEGAWGLAPENPCLFLSNDSEYTIELDLHLDPVSFLAIAHLSGFEKPWLPVSDLYNKSSLMMGGEMFGEPVRELV